MPTRTPQTVKAQLFEPGEGHYFYVYIFDNKHKLTSISDKPRTVSVSYKAETNDDCKMTWLVPAVGEYFGEALVMQQTFVYGSKQAPLKIFYYYDLLTQGDPRNAIEKLIQQNRQYGPVLVMSFKDMRYEEYCNLEEFSGEDYYTLSNYFKDYFINSCSSNLVQTV